jgi:hypothetical protein
MAKRVERVVGTPISVQEHRETLSATVDVESGMTDFIIKRTLVDADNGEVVSAQKIRETAPTAEVKEAITEAVEKSADVKQPEPEAV